MSRPTRLNPSRTVDTSEDAAGPANRSKSPILQPSASISPAPISTAQYTREDHENISHADTFENDQSRSPKASLLGSVSDQIEISDAYNGTLKDRDEVLISAASENLNRSARFIVTLSRWPCVATAARLAGVSIQRMQSKRRRDPAFEQAWDEAWVAGTAEVERIVLQRGFKGTREPIFSKGKLVGYRRIFSEPLALKWLEAHMPERYGRKVSVTSSATVSHVYGITPELERLVHRIAGARGLDAPEPVTIDQEPATTGPADVLRRMLGNPEDGAEPLPVVQERVE